MPPIPSPSGRSTLSATARRKGSLAVAQRTTTSASSFLASRFWETSMISKSNFPLPGCHNSFAFQSFSSQSTTTSLDALSLAAEEGRRVSELKRRSSRRPLAVANTSTGGTTPRYLLKDQNSQPTPGSNRKLPSAEAVQAADALLIVTQCIETIGKAILLNLPENQDKVVCLHKAFLTIIQWCLSVATNRIQEELDGLDDVVLPATDMSILLQRAWNLAERAHDLHLPLTLPLYTKLATVMATNEPGGDPARVLQVAHWVHMDLMSLSVKADQPLSPFWRLPLVALVRQGHLRHVLHILEEMQAVYGIQILDAETTQDLVWEVRRVFRQEVADASVPGNLHEKHLQHRQDEAVQLVLWLEESIWSMLDVPGAKDEDPEVLWQAMEEVLAAKDQSDGANASASDRGRYPQTEGLDEYSDEDADSDHDESDDHQMNENDFFAMLGSIDSRDWKHFEVQVKGEDHPDGSGKKRAKISLIDRRVHHFDPSHRYFAVYTRSPGGTGYLRNDDCPDLLPQLYHMNGQREILYTEDYETQVYKMLNPEAREVLDGMEEETGPSPETQA